MFKEFIQFLKESLKRVFLPAILFFKVLNLPGATELSGYEKIIEAGSIAVTDQKEYTFVVANDSEDTQFIKDISSSCGCLKISSVPESIPAKTKKEIIVKLIPEQTGDFAFQLTVVLDNEDIKKFLLNCTIIQDVKTICSEDFIDVEKVKNQLDQGKIALIDTRKPEDFKSFYIPGSLNIPLHLIKTKPFLKNKLIVLVSKGFEYDEFFPEMNKIKQAGFQIKIMKGGLVSWISSQGNWEGNPEIIETLKYITINEWVPEMKYDHWIKVYVDTPLTIKPSFLEDAVCTGKSVTESELLNEIKQAIDYKKKCSLINVLVVNNNGDYNSIKDCLKNKENNIFFLKGGLHAYGKFIKMKESIQTVRTMTQKSAPCKGCP